MIQKSLGRLKTDCSNGQASSGTYCVFWELAYSPIFPLRQSWSYSFSEMRSPVLVSEPGKSGLGMIFDTFWYGAEYFE